MMEKHFQRIETDPKGVSDATMVCRCLQEKQEWLIEDIKKNV